jgi:drug/metabolite transporter (DMT)-like permease
MGCRAGRWYAVRRPLVPASRASDLVQVHAAVLLFGFAGLFGKWLALPPVVIVLGRTLVATLALAAIVLACGRPAAPTRRLMANGFVLAIHWVAFFEAIAASSVAIGLLGYATFPLFVLVLERWLLRRRFSGLELATAALVTAGLVVLVPSLDAGDATLRGLAWGMLSGFTFAVLAVRSRALAQTHSPWEVAAWQNAFAALVLLPIAWLGRAAIPDLGLRDIALIVVLGLACTALAHTLFIASLRRLSAHTASIVAALEPVYGIALALLLLHEVPATRTLCGGVLIVLAALLATRRVA